MFGGNRRENASGGRGSHVGPLGPHQPKAQPRLRLLAGSCHRNDLEVLSEGCVGIWLSLSIMARFGCLVKSW